MNLATSTLILILVTLLMAPSCYATDSVWQNYNDSAQAAYKKGDIEEAEKLFKLAIEQASKTSNEKQELEKSLFDFGWMYNQLKRYVEAEKMYDQLLALRQKLFGPNDMNVARAYRLLGNVQTAEGKYGEAEANLKQALQITEFHAKSDQPPKEDNNTSLIGVLKDLAQVCKLEQKNAESQAYMKRAETLAFGYMERMRTGQGK